MSSIYIARLNKGDVVTVKKEFHEDFRKDGMQTGLFYIVNSIGFSTNNNQFFCSLLGFRLDFPEEYFKKVAGYEAISFYSR